jgi:transposase
MKLVSLVADKGFSIAKAGKRLKIKPSTAKLIVKKFKDNGIYFQSKEQRNRLATAPAGESDADSPKLQPKTYPCP